MEGHVVKMAKGVKEAKGRKETKGSRGGKRQ